MTTVAISSNFFNGFRNITNITLEENRSIQEASLQFVAEHKLNELANLFQFSLIHKHFDLLENEVVVAVEKEGQLVIQPTTDTQGIVPYMWCFNNGEWKAFQYLKVTQQNGSFIAKLSSMSEALKGLKNVGLLLQSAGLEGKIGLCAAFSDLEVCKSCKEGEVMLEQTFSNRHQTFAPTRVDKLSEGKLYETIWTIETDSLGMLTYRCLGDCHERADGVHNCYHTGQQEAL